MSELTDFILLKDPTVRIVALGVLLIAVSSALIGNYTFLRKRAMIGDAISHSIFPGICLSFIIEGEKDPISMIIYATVFGLGANLLIDAIAKHPKIKAETSIGIVLSAFFGLGVVMLSYIQGNLEASQSGLQHYIFGNAAAMSKDDIDVFLINTVLIISVLIVFHNGFKLVSFDKGHARVRGIRVNLLEGFLNVLTVLAIAMGINAVGLILMAALLITPASSARLWTNRLIPMMILGLVFTIASAIAGTFVSYKYAQMPTGPWIVVFLSFIAFTSILFAPDRGSVARIIARNRLNRKVLHENVLKAMYKLKSKQDNSNGYTLDEINTFHDLDGKKLQTALKQLKSNSMVSQKAHLWALTDSGFTEGKRIVRAHRLWEMYLANKVNISSDHVHPSAESLEHFITPELEQKLKTELDNPTIGPHNDEIPE